MKVHASFSPESALTALQISGEVQNAGMVFTVATKMDRKGWAAQARAANVIIIVFDEAYKVNISRSCAIYRPSLPLSPLPVYHSHSERERGASDAPP